ncbi:SLBB domain-containing protein [Gallaecimonas mangrovi]|uniref:SLBB domain-containing protein n=1 Tax=Gallaecimonas mangrovi TaxID=2291597 RepID=UPI001D018201|nr:SLBB domain-containing protein [Gallaecimonas mangrovi]
MFKKFGLFLLTLVVWGTASAASLSTSSISPAMIQQFQNMSTSQQQALAQQYGIDLSSLTGGSSGSSSSGASSQGVQQTQSSVLQQRQLNQQMLQQQQSQNTDNGTDKPKRFGMNLFDADVSMFAPVDTASVPDDYVVGPNDVIDLILYGKESQEQSLTVSRDGTINLPDLGPIKVGGLTFGEVKKVVKAKVKDEMIGQSVAISLSTMRNISVFVAGEAKYPGSYSLPALTTVTQALFVAGGVSDIGSLRHIVIKRGGKTVRHFDLYDLLLKGDASDDIRLQSGDVVFIPPYTGLAEVKGEVRRPALYELNKNDTLGDLLAMAGGADSDAYPQSSVLERINGQNLRDIQNVNLTNKKALDEKVRGGDVLRVGATSDQATNAIVLAGAVVRPGKYAWHQGMHVNDLIRSLWGDLRLSADLDYALVIRQVNALGDIQVHQFQLGNAVTKPSSKDNLTLQPKDIVLVFNYDDDNINRKDLNDYITQDLQPVLTASSDQRWLTGDLMSNGFQYIQDNNDKKKQDVNSVAGMNIDDAATAKQQQDAANQMTTQKTQQLADGTVVTTNTTSGSSDTGLSQDEQQSTLSDEVNHLLSNIYTDPKLIALTPEMKRQELLYPVMAKLNAQARNGAPLQVVSITGDVKVPGKYPLSVNGDITGLVKAAGGLSASAYYGRAELTRAKGNNKDLNGITVTHKAIDLENAMKGGNDNVALVSRDNLNIFATPDWQVDRTVEIRGEVRFPGSYTIHRGETLHDVIQRAGGVTQYAFVDGAVFTRKQVQEREQIQVNKLIEQLRSTVATRALSSNTTTISYQDATNMIGELQNIKPVGRLVIDLPDILSGDKAADMQAEDGDILYIPRKTTTISVVGEVQYASSHRFKKGLNVEDYLNLSGGFRKRADESRVYVIRADGSVMIPNQSHSWFTSNDDSQLKPGDTIVVPLDTEYQDNLKTWSSVTSIIYQSAVALAAISSL